MVPALEMYDDFITPERQVPASSCLEAVVGLPLLSRGSVWMRTYVFWAGTVRRRQGPEEGAGWTARTSSSSPPARSPPPSVPSPAFLFLFLFIHSHSHPNSRTITSVHTCHCAPSFQNFTCCFYLRGASTCLFLPYARWGPTKIMLEWKTFPEGTDKSLPFSFELVLSQFWVSLSMYR